MNIGLDYKVHRDNLLDIFEIYKKNKESFDGEFNFQITDGVDLNNLEKEIDKIKKKRFIIAVAGEVKSGKSTFLNALIGEEILPTDVLQATSAIIELFKSEHKHLIVEYGSKRKERYEDYEVLKDLAKLSDEFRRIEPSIIDDLILNGEEIISTEEVLKYLEDQTNNKYGKPELELIDKYLNSRTKDDIPIKIEFGYPIKWEFDELIIVDTPGVNAVGGVQDISYKYYSNANAILFIHSIKPIESEPFNNFVDKIISNRSRDNLFLIFTHISQQTDENVKKLHDEAIRLYGAKINKDRILVVDSLLQVILNDLERGVDLEKIRENELKRNTLSRYREEASDNNIDLKDVLKTAARFESVSETIDKFIMEAPIMDIKKLFEKIINGLEQQEKHYTDNINKYNQKKKSPQVFAKSIGDIITALEEYKLLMNEVSEYIQNKYSGTNTDWIKEIQLLRDNYEELMNHSSSFEELRKRFVDFHNDMQDEIEFFTNNLISDIRNKVRDENIEFNKSYNIILPSIDYDAIEESTKNSSLIRIPIFIEQQESLWENYNLFKLRWTKKKRTVKKVDGSEELYSKDLHLQQVKQKAVEAIFESIPNVEKEFKEIFNDTMLEFEKTIKSVIEKRQELLEKEKTKKMDNDKIIEHINILNKKKETLGGPISRIKSILEDLK